MSAGHVGGTRGSGIVSSAADVLWMSVVCGMRGAGSHVFALLMLSLCVILHTMWSGKSLQLLCILPFGMLYLSAISMIFVKILLAVCMLVGMVV